MKLSFATSIQFKKYITELSALIVLIDCVSTKKTYKEALNYNVNRLGAW